jgi:acylphosphatase
VTALLLVARGKVQGVGFRSFALRRARELSLRGWVRNAPGGEVESLVVGSAEAVEEFARRLGEGPSSARVTGLERRPASEDGAPDRFEIRSW